MRNLKVILFLFFLTIFCEQTAISQTAEDYYNSGILKCALKQYSSAILYYTKAIELEPDYAEVYNDRGFVKDDLKDYWSAITDYDKAIVLVPDNPEDIIIEEQRNINLKIIGMPYQIMIKQLS